MALPEKIKRFITVDDIIALDSSLDAIKVEIVVEDIFAYITTAICPAICANDWKDISIVRSVLRNSAIRKLRVHDDAEVITQTQGDNSETRRYSPRSSANYYLTIEEKEALISSCKAYKSSIDVEASRRYGSEATRLLEATGAIGSYGSKVINSNGFYDVTHESSIAPVLTHTSLPVELY